MTDYYSEFHNKIVNDTKKDLNYSDEYLNNIKNNKKDNEINYLKKSKKVSHIFFCFFLYLVPVFFIPYFFIDTNLQLLANTFIIILSIFIIPIFLYLLLKAGDNYEKSRDILYYTTYNINNNDDSDPSKKIKIAVNNKEISILEFENFINAYVSKKNRYLIYRKYEKWIKDNNVTDFIKYEDFQNLLKDTLNLKKRNII